MSRPAGFALANSRQRATLAPTEFIAENGPTFIPGPGIRDSMKPAGSRLAAVCAIFALFAAAMAATSAQASRVGVLSNNYAGATAADFATKIPGHTFTGVDTSAVLPALPGLLAAYDVLLVFEDCAFTT